MPTRSRSSVPPDVAGTTCWQGHDQEWERLEADPEAWRAVCRICGEETTVYLPRSEGWIWPGEEG